jgi:hypothetical protein
MSEWVKRMTDGIRYSVFGIQYSVFGIQWTANSVVAYALERVSPLDPLGSASSPQASSGLGTSLARGELAEPNRDTRSPGTCQ